MCVLIFLGFPDPLFLSPPLTLADSDNTHVLTHAHTQPHTQTKTHTHTHINTEESGDHMHNKDKQPAR